MRSILVSMCKQNRLPAWFASATTATISLILLAAVSSIAQTTTREHKAESSSASSNSSLVDRGRYIVEDVAVCSQCHTPRDSSGNLDRNHWLEGGPLWLEPAPSMPDWPTQVPRIAGNPPGTDAELVQLLTTGIWRSGKFLRAPMPQFRLSNQDAQAVVAYLKSLRMKP